MNSALSEFLRTKPQQQTAEQPATENQRSGETLHEIDYRAFGVNRNGRHALMLDVRRLDKVRLALAYPYLNSVFFDPSGVIVLSFGSHNVRIMGRNLEPLYEGVLNHAVRYVRQENAELETDVSKDETFISSIEVDEAGA